MLVVDDHAGFREMARALAVSGGLEVVAEAADGATALTLCQEHHPDLVLLDIGLPDLDGFDVRRRMLEGLDPPVGPAHVLPGRRGIRRAALRARAHRLRPQG